MERKPWMDQAPPPGYVPGLGRGANGFTTRSDIGPMRSSPPPMESPAIPVPKNPDDEDDDREDYSESNYDEWQGYGGSFFDASTPYDQDDKEADEIWTSIDARMDSKRKRRREEKMKEELEKYRLLRPKIQSQFADLKRELSSVSSLEWENIPEIGDHTARKRKKVKPNLSFVPVPDSLIEKARSENEHVASINVRGLETPVDPLNGADTSRSSLTDIGEARTAMLKMNLNKMSDSVSGQTVVDPKGYLTDMNSMKVTSDAEIGDIKKARALLRSVVTTNPKHAPGWIAFARLEELTGKLGAARKLIAEACETCPESEDVWIEAARLNTPESAKVILAKAVKEVPQSVKIWLQAASLETDIKTKQLVLRKALEFVPNSVKLWKAAIELEEPEDARILLTKAVECVPYSVEMWLALAQLETYENARKVLNQARNTIPTDLSIWITAAKLEEAHDNHETARALVPRALKSLAKHQVVVTREQLLKEAQTVEKVGAITTCQALVKESMELGVEEEDRKRVWLEDAENLIGANCINCARAVYAYALTVFPKKKSLWQKVAQLEKTYGTPETLQNILKKAVEECPKAEILWLMGAKEKWLAGDTDGAREILRNAFAANPDSEQIWLAAVKLENESNQTEKARNLLKEARDRAGTERVWLKSALLERELHNVEGEKALLDEALKQYPQYPKFWMMRAQFEERQGNLETSAEYYQRGLKNCPQSIPLWLCAIQLEEKISPTRARSLFEKAKMFNKQNPELWIMAIDIELRTNNKKLAENLLAKALQECPNSGMLWAKAIEMESRPQKKARSVDALRRCDNDPYVVTAVANLMLMDGKYDKARTWFNRAVTINSDYGDAWAYYYKLEIRHGTEQQQQEVIKKCTDAEPHHGKYWQMVSKAIGNERLKIPQILKEVVKILPEIK